jgi:small subunit ribosomal protein S6
MAKKTPPPAKALSQYEAMFLLGPVGAAEPERSIELCKGIIERHGGQIIVIKKWDERKLAYELHGQKRGTYIIAFFRGPGEAVGHIERDVNLSEEILRCMVLKADHLNEKEMNEVEPQPIAPPREERPMDDRGGFGGGGFGDRRPREDRGGFGGGGGGGGGGYGDRPPRRREEAPAGADKE